MQPPLRLPAKTVYLSSCSRLPRAARSKPCCAERDDRPSSAAKSGARHAHAVPRVAARSGHPRRALMATATFDINELKRRMQGAMGVLKQELSGLRTGRASPHLLDHVQAEAYGSHMPLNQLATVRVPEPRLISVQVWDRSMVHAVEKA